jgi:L-alanine-DL-glutamate epimerase-like enolase superfamily enzyme
MKITNVRSIIIKMPFTKAGLTGSVPSPSLMLIVEVSTDGGINGIGQSFTTLSSNSAATLANCLETMIKPKVAGKDPLAITGLWN